MSWGAFALGMLAGWLFTLFTLWAGGRARQRKIIQGAMMAQLAIQVDAAKAEVEMTKANAAARLERAARRPGANRGDFHP